MQSSCEVLLANKKVGKQNDLFWMRIHDFFQNSQSFICMQNAQTFRRSAGRDGKEVVH